MEHSAFSDDPHHMLTLTPPVSASPIEPTLRSALSPFAAMIAAAARLPLVPVADWTTRAAQSLNAGTAGSGALVTLYNNRTRQVVHAGADSALHAQPSGVLLLAQAEDLVRDDAAHDDERAHSIAWVDSMHHPFHQAGFGVGTVTRARARLDEHLSLSLDVYRPQPLAEGVECAMIDGVAEFLLQSLRAFIIPAARRTGSRHARPTCWTWSSSAIRSMTSPKSSGAVLTPFTTISRPFTAKPAQPVAAS